MPCSHIQEITSLLGITITGVADPVPTNQPSGSVVYGVRANVTLESPELDVPEGTGLHYDGDLAVYKLGRDTYLARFLNFSMIKHEPSTRTTCPGCSLETLIIAPPERRYQPSAAVNDAFRTQAHTSSVETRIIAPPERRYPSRTAVNDAVRPQVGTETLVSAPRRYPPHTAVNDAARSQVGAPGMETLIIAPPERGYPANAAVVKYEIGAAAPAWVNSVYKSVLTLLQNQVETPRDLPSVSSYYENSPAVNDTGSRTSAIAV
ncbi:hypothetical protein HPB50_005276 [Hyalomma asiaticum]|uniref:Uncharacterized protein n=1 Tax=Hyalomma asiaticum TaxID=266040 RepID=A0ACB7T5N8_HYAAI|nr:hypothetical protein HPB50_005276 [Hyalomma asiaticum]